MTAPAELPTRRWMSTVIAPAELTDWQWRAVEAWLRGHLFVWPSRHGKATARAACERIRAAIADPASIVWFPPIIGPVAPECLFANGRRCTRIYTPLACGDRSCRIAADRLLSEP